MDQKLIQKISKLRITGKINEAIRVINNKLSKNPKDLDCLHILLDIHYTTGDFPAAQKIIDFISSFSEDDIFIKYAQVRVYLDQGKNEETLKIAKNMLLSEGLENNNEWNRIRGIAEYRRGNRSIGIDILEECHYISPYDGNIAVDLIEMLCAEGLKIRGKEVIDFYETQRTSFSYTSYTPEHFDMKVEKAKIILLRIEDDGERTVQDYSGRKPQNMQSVSEGDGDS